MVIDLEAIKDKKTLHALQEEVIYPYILADILRSILKSEQYIDQGKEHFWVVGLNTHNLVKCIDLISLGTLSASLVHPREVFRFAVLSGVCNLILAHNHPSGVPKPSGEDIRITSRLVEAGRILGIDVLDHLIISEKHFTSMKEENFSSFGSNTAEHLRTRNTRRGSPLVSELKTDGPFNTSLQVVRYLVSQGWNIKKSSVYNHIKAGKLVPDGEGRFSRKDVDQCALTNLKKKGSTAASTTSRAGAGDTGELLDYKTKFKVLKKTEQPGYINETGCLLAFLKRAAINLCSNSVGLKPNNDEIFGMQLIFDEVDKRMKASQAAFE